MSTRPTALHIACCAGDLERVRLLLAAGADANAPATHGLRPLHIAARAYAQARSGFRQREASTYESIIVELLDARADILARDQLGQMAAAWAEGFMADSLRAAMIQRAEAGEWTEPADDSRRSYYRPEARRRAYERDMRAVA